MGASSHFAPGFRIEILPFAASTQFFSDSRHPRGTGRLLSYNDLSWSLQTGRDGWTQLWSCWSLIASRSIIRTTELSSTCFWLAFHVTMATQTNTQMIYQDLRGTLTRVNLRMRLLRDLSTELISVIHNTTAMEKIIDVANVSNRIKER